MGGWGTQLSQQRRQNVSQSPDLEHPADLVVLGVHLALGLPGHMQGLPRLLQAQLEKKAI